MRILITGGAGFIGSHLTDALLEKGHVIMVIDNLSTGKMSNLPKKENEFFTFKNESISSGMILREILNDFLPEMIIHCAASYKDPNDWWGDTFNNTFGMQNLLKLCMRYEYPVKRFIYFQTSLCYGKPLFSPITTQHPLSPGSSYAISKTAAEQYLIMSGLPYISFRLANIYGPRNLSGAVPTFYKNLSEQKMTRISDTRRDFVYIDDLLEVVLKAVDGQGENGIYHVSTGYDYAIEDIFDEIAVAMGKTKADAFRQPRGADDVESLLLDPSDTMKMFEWEATTPLSDGIIRTVDWYDNNPVGETYTHLKMRG